MHQKEHLAQVFLKVANGEERICTRPIFIFESVELFEHYEEIYTYKEELHGNAIELQ